MTAGSSTRAASTRTTSTSAYRELEKRYYTGEGAAFAEAGATVTELTLALNRADFDTLFDELTASDFRIENRSRSAFPDRSPGEYRTTLEELEAMVVSARGVEFGHLLGVSELRRSPL